MSQILLLSEIYPKHERGGATQPITSLVMNKYLFRYEPNTLVKDKHINSLFFCGLAIALREINIHKDQKTMFTVKLEMKNSLWLLPKRLVFKTLKECKSYMQEFADLSHQKVFGVATSDRVSSKPHVIAFYPQTLTNDRYDEALGLTAFGNHQLNADIYPGQKTTQVITINGYEHFANLTEFGLTYLSNWAKFTGTKIEVQDFNPETYFLGIEMIFSKNTPEGQKIITWKYKGDDHQLILSTTVYKQYKQVLLNYLIYKEYSGEITNISVKDYYPYQTKTVEETAIPESTTVEETAIPESTTVEETAIPEPIAVDTLSIKYWCSTGITLNLLGMLPSKIKYTPKDIRTFKNTVRKLVFLTEHSVSYTLSDGQFNKYEKIKYYDLIDQEYSYSPQIGERHNIYNHLLLNKWLPCGISAGAIKVIITIVGKKQFNVFVDSKSLQEFEYWLLTTGIKFKVVNDDQDIVYLDPDQPSPAVEIVSELTKQQIIAVKFKESCRTKFIPSKDEDEKIEVKAIEGFKPVEKRDTVTLVYHNDIWYEWKRRGNTFDLYKYLGLNTKIVIGKIKIQTLLPVDCYRVGKQLHWSKLVVNKLVGNFTKGSDPSQQYKVWLKYSDWLHELKNCSPNNYSSEFNSDNNPYSLLENKLLQNLYDSLVDNSPKTNGEYLEKKPNRSQSKKLRNDKYNKIKKEYSSLFPNYWDSDRIKLALKVLTDDYNIQFIDSDLEILEAVIRWVNLQLPPVK